jgi:hypothetical protein
MRESLARREAVELSAELELEVSDSDIDMNDKTEGDAAAFDRKRESSLINQLRTEGNELKGCFTRHSFQAISLCSIAIAGILHFMVQEPIVALGAVGILPIIFSVCQLGIYKFSASNRHFGYELYLTRTRNVPPEFRGRWKPEYRQLGWEEAMQAWRVVHATLFETIYTKGRMFIPERLRSQFRPRRYQTQWFVQRTLFGPGARAKWHAGTYLRKMLFMLHCTAFGAAALVLVSLLFISRMGGELQCHWSEHLVRLYHPTVIFGLQTTKELLVVASIGCVMVLLIWAQGIADRQRSKMLEDGGLSIRACSIIWQAAVVAHFTALANSRKFKLNARQLNAIVRSLKGRERRDAMAGNAAQYVERVLMERTITTYPEGTGLPGFQFWLGQEAVSLARCAADIEAWIGMRQLPDTIERNE